MFCPFLKDQNYIFNPSDFPGSGHYVPAPAVPQSDPHQYPRRTVQSNSNDVLNRESSSSGLDSIDVLHSESLSSSSGPANEPSPSAGHNSYNGGHEPSTFVDPTTEAVDFLNWVASANPTTAQDATNFDKRYWATDAAYKAAISQELQDLQTLQGRSASIIWKEDLDHAASLPLSPHDKSMLDLKRQVKDLTSAYGLYYSVTVTRKLKPEDFKAIATPGAEIYQVTVTGLSPVQYRERDVTTNQPLNNQPLRLSALSFMQYQHTEALLVTTQTSFTSSGETEILCKQGDKAKVTMENEFDADVPVLIEMPPDAQTENKIVGLEDEISKD